MARLAKLFAELDEFHRRGRFDLFQASGSPARKPAEIEALIARPDTAILVTQDSAFPHLIALATVRVRQIEATPRRRAQTIAEVENTCVLTRQAGCGLTAPQKPPPQG